ncbi:hypothetical protein ACIVBQ_001366 [Tenacibaculum discolor]
MKQNKETLKEFFETGDKPTQQQYADLIDSYIDAKQPEGEVNRRFVIDETGEVSVASEQQVPEYTLSPISGTNAVDLLKDGVSVSQIDLTPYLDNTNLARLVSGTVDANGLATFTRDDNSIFTVDLSNLKDTVPQYQAGTNITIDTTDPDNPVINASGGGATDVSNLVPYTGAVNDLNLGNHYINLGKEATVVEKNKSKTLLTSDDVPFFKLGTESWNGEFFVQDYGRSIGIGREALDNYKGNGNLGFGRRAGYNLDGTGNYLLGMNAGDNLKGNYNLALGSQVARNLSGLYNVQLGNQTGSTTTGNHNIGIGLTTAYSLMGNYNIGIGSNTANALLGDYNTLIGSGANGYETPRDLSKKYIIEASDIASNAEITILEHGFPVGSRKMFYYEKDSTDPTSETLVNIGSRNTNASIWEVIDTNTLKCLTETYIGNAVGRQTFTEFLPINNSTAIGNGAKLTKSNQMVLGDDDLEEVTTAGDYVSTGVGKGLILKTPDGTKQYRISIDDSGNIVTTLI